ncbi:unnamed protein product [Ectocarpus sp. 4 AP-2014]
MREIVQEFGVEGCDAINDGQLALRAAARKHHLDVMAILTEAGGVDTAGLALGAAAANGREESVKFLLRQRCKEGNNSNVDDVYINARPNGCTPLTASIHSCFSQAPKILRLLIDAGTDTTTAVRAANSQGELEFNRSPLAVTTSCLREKILQRANLLRRSTCTGWRPSVACCCESRQSTRCRGDGQAMLPLAAMLQGVVPSRICQHSG